MMHYGYGGLWGFGFFIILLLIGLITYVAIRLSQGSDRSYSKHRAGNDALDILNRRYANGEISDEEYIQKKNILRD